MRGGTYATLVAATVLAVVPAPAAVHGRAGLAAADLASYFKPASFGTAGATLESEPRPGVQIYRDEFNVPTVLGATFQQIIEVEGHRSDDGRSPGRPTRRRGRDGPE